jgi:large subunit ribosomal protein L21
VAAKDLNEQGITTFAQLAGLSDADIETIDANMPFSAEQIRDWREQAKELAKK